MLKALKHFILPLVILLSIQAKSQDFVDTLKNKTYDEIRALFPKYRTDSLKVKTIATFYLDKAKKERDTLKMAKGYHLLYYISNYENKQKYLDSIITVTRYKQNEEFPAQAYFHKAQLYLYQKRNVEQTINYLNEARKYAKLNNNTDLIYRIDYQIAVIKSEHLNEKEEALIIFKKCANFYSQNFNGNNSYLYLNTLHAISDTYIGIKKHDSASYYNNLGYSKAKNASDINQDQLKYYFVLCEGINKYLQKEYVPAIDSISNALPLMIEFDDQSNVIDSYFYLGKSYHDLGRKEKAIPYFKKTDSVLETLNSIPQYKHVKTYEYLKNYYKVSKDLENQNKYLDKLNAILNNYLNDQIHISKRVKEDYDIPLLREEQEIVVKQLNKDTSTYQSSIVILILLIFGLGGVVLYLYRRKQLYRLRFEALIANDKPITQQKQDEIEQPETIKKELRVPEKHVTYILNKLDEFEKEKKYLVIGVTSQSLADDMETNIKYLSRTINYYKHKNFTHYLNELRIAYALEELKRNSTLRKFTIKAIANEMGYNSAETFSNAFYKQVKIKPSYFIKNLDKIN